MIDINESTVTTFVDFALKGFLILAIAFAFDSVFRKSNSTVRNLIWVIALTAVLFLPFVSAMLPQMELPLLQLLPQENVGLDEAALLNTDLADVETGGFSLSLIDILGITVFVYLLGVFTVVAWQVVGHLYARRIRNGAMPITDPACTEPFAAIRKRYDLSNAVRLLKSEKASKPFSSGIFRPAIILPVDACSWPPSILRSVITHEVAHIKRLDIAYRAVAQLACAINWFNPLAWFGLKKLLVEQEIACDEFVLNAGIKPSVYAQSLLAVANVKHARLDFAMAAIGRKGELKDRLFEILRPTRSRRQLSIRFAALASFVSVLMLIPVFMVNIWNDNSGLKASNFSIKSESTEKDNDSTDEASRKEKKAEEKKSESSGTSTDEKMTKELIMKKLEKMKANGASEEEIRKFKEQAQKKLAAQNKKTTAHSSKEPKSSVEKKGEKPSSTDKLKSKEESKPKELEAEKKKKGTTKAGGNEKKPTDAAKKKAELDKKKAADLKKAQKEKEKKNKDS